MCLNLVHLLKCGERPCDDFAILSTSEDAAVVLANDEGENGAAVLEAVD